MVLETDGWAIIKLRADSNDGDPLTDEQVKEINEKLKDVASKRDDVIVDPWALSKDGTLTLENVMTSPDEQALALLMELKGVLDEYDVDFGGEIYMLNIKNTGVVRWRIRHDMVVSTMEALDPTNPSYEGGQPLNVQFKDGVKVRVVAS